MKLTKHLNELINSGVTLNAKETKLVEDYLQSQTRPVKRSHLPHYLCVASVRGKGTDVQSY